MGRVFNKKSVAAFAGLLGTMIIGAFIITSTQSNAANDGYFGGYDAIKSINLDGNYTASQGFHIHKNEAYYVKIANKGTAKSGKSRIWVYDLSSKSNKVVYNGDGLYEQDENYYYKGMDVDNYGFVNQKTGLLESTFWQRGSHL